MRQKQARLLILVALSLAATLLSGCGMLFGGSEEAAATPTAEPRVVVPTFTPTPVGAATATPAAVAVEPTLAITVDTPAAVEAGVTSTLTSTLTGTQTTTDTAAVTGTTTATGTTTVTDTTAVTGTTGLTGTTAVTGTASTTAPVAAAPAVTPSLKVETDIINVRSGPGTDYGLVGSANLGESFAIVGRNADGSWYQICCVNGQQGWVSADFTDENNEELAPLVEAPTAPQPVAAAPTTAPAAQPTAAPAEPAATPAPAAPPPAADACAGIGGDGCKFKLRGGPSFAQRRRRTQDPVRVYSQRHRRRPAAGQLLRLDGEGRRQAARFGQHAQHCLGARCRERNGQVQLRVQDSERPVRCRATRWRATT
jgi:hypothetical protein